MSSPFTIHLEDHREGELAVSMLRPKRYPHKNVRIFQYLFMGLAVTVVVWFGIRPGMILTDGEQWSVDPLSGLSYFPGFCIPSSWDLLIAPAPFILSFVGWSVIPWLLLSRGDSKLREQTKVIRSYGGVQRFQKSQPDTFRQIAAILVFIGFLCWPILLVLFWSSQSQTAVHNIPTVALPIFLLILGWFIAFFWMKITRATQLRIRDNAISQYNSERGSITVYADENGLNWRDKDLNSQSAWSRFKFFAETENVFVLNAGPAGNMVIPKRAFASPEEAHTFLDYLTRHIGNGWVLAGSDRAMGFPVQPIMARLGDTPPI